MRKPFLFFLALISLFCWLTDFIRLFFYFANIQTPHKNVFSYTGSAVIIIFGLFLTAYFLNRKNNTAGLWLKDVFQSGTKKEWLYFLLASSPVIILGLIRSILPDQNFDTYHFELYLQEADFSENKINWGAGAIRTYYFPLPERIYALFRYILGYRLGTFVNTILLVTIIAAVYDFIVKFTGLLGAERKHKLLVLTTLSLLAVLADNTFFTIGSYKPDLMGLPFVLELVTIVFFGNSGTNKILNYTYFFLVASLTLTFKLTYLPYTGLLCLIYFIKNFKTLPPFQRFAIPAFVLLLPSIYMLYNLQETGNPLFPFFNSIFRSPLYPPENFKDGRWGHRSASEFFIYHIVTLLDKSRNNEWSLYSYRLLFGYFICIGAIITWLIQRRKAGSGNNYFKQLVFLAMLAVGFDYACLITTGYYRYGAIVEIMYGIIIVLGVLSFNTHKLALLLLLPLLFQTYTTFENIFIKNINLSWHDYSSLKHNKEVRNANLKRLLSDRGSVTDNSRILPMANAFVSLEPFPFDGLSKMLNNKVPVYDLLFYGRTPDSISAFEKNVIQPKSQTQNLFVTATNESLYNGVWKALNKKGYLVTDMYEVYPDFMLPGEPLFLLKIKYHDTAAYRITSQIIELKEENAPETRNDFIYASKNKLTAFIREAPFVFNWNSLPAQFDLIINDVKYSTANRFEGKKTFKVEADSIKVHKPEIIPFLVIIQEIVNK